MKIYFYISVAASALSLVLAIVLFAIGGVNQGLQAEVQKQQQQLQQEQQELNKTQQMLRDMAAASTKDEEMKKLLEHYGYKVVTPTPAPAASPAPAKPAARTESPDLKP